LGGLEFDQPGLRVAVDEAHGAVLAVQARRDRLDGAIGELAAAPPWAPLVGRLGCLGGVGVLTSFGLAVEIGDWHRFTGATLGAWLGLVPSEQSSGGRRAQGAITKTGNSHARRLVSAGRSRQALHRQRGRGRPRACRLVLEPGRLGGLTEHPSWPVGRHANRARSHPRHTYEQPGHDHGW
jgi:transposase